jgi:hypothetical protein
VGLPSGLSVGAGVNYGFKNNNWTFTANTSIAGFYAYGGYDTKAGWIGGAGFSAPSLFPAVSPITISSNLWTAGVSYSEHGGWSGNFSAINISKSGATIDPSVGASLQYSIVNDNYESPAKLCHMKDSNFKTKDEMMADLREKGFMPGTKKINEFRYKEWDGNSREAGKTTGIYRGNKLIYLRITMLPHETTDMFYESFNHELIHAYDHVKYGLTVSDSYRETKAYRYTDRFKAKSTLPSDTPVYSGNVSLWDLPDYLVPTINPILKPKLFNISK